MKARTKNQKRVVSLNKKVPKIGVRIKKWAFENAIPHMGVRSQAGTCNCYKCGHTWKGSKEAWHDDVMGVTCPNCKREIDLHSTNKRTATIGEYFSVVTTVAEYQVVTTYKIRCQFKAKEACKPEPDTYESGWRNKSKYWFVKCYRIFIREDGKREVTGMVAGGMGYYNNNYQGDFCLRNPRVIDRKYDGEGILYPKWKLQPYLIRAGFDAYVYQESGYTVVACAKTLLSNPMAETFVKRGWIGFFKMTMRRDLAELNDYWPTLKICMRNNYDIVDPESYFDMLRILDFYEKDILNPHYVCPRDFDEAHDYWIEKKAKHDVAERRRFEEANKLAAAKKRASLNTEYEKRLKKFSKLKLVSGNIEVRPFLKLDEVELAGQKMHHCIFKSSSYWTKKSNLLLGTYLNGRLIETTQYDLDQSKIYHSYGVNNKPSIVHDQLIELINKNKTLIAAMAKPKKKRKKAVAA